MKVVMIDINQIKPYDKNPRKNNNAVEAVANSIKEFGFKQPIVVDKDNIIVVGHTRFKAAKKLGLKEVPVVVATDLTDEQIKAYRLADNKTNELAEWDDELLSGELSDIEMDMSLFGFDLEEEEEKEIIEDEAPEVDEESEPITKLGDIWQLGNHRLMCGDSTDKATVEKLMNGAKADMVFTDPPYGIKADKGFSGAGGFSGVGKPIPRRKYNDNWDSFTPPKSCFDMMIELAKKVIIFGGNFFTDKLPQGSHWIVWNKHNTMPTFGDAELAWTNIKRNSVKLYDCEYNGLIGKEKERFHPTQKPIKLISPIIKDYSENGNCILDLFGGSGSTLIACEQLNRTCYMMELDPKYCDVIIKRWETLTGKKAELISNG